MGVTPDAAGEKAGGEDARCACVFGGFSIPSEDDGELKPVSCTGVSADAGIAELDGNSRRPIAGTGSPFVILALGDLGGGPAPLPLAAAK